MDVIKRDIEALWVANTEYPSDAVLRAHSHKDYYQIYYVIAGEGDFLIAEDTVKLSKGMFLFCSPGVSHGIAQSRDVGGKSLSMVEIKFTVLSHELKYSLERVPPVCTGSEDFERLFLLMHREGINKEPNYYTVIYYSLGIVLNTLSRKYTSYYSDGFGNGSSEQPRITKMIKEYINQNYTKDISLDDIAESMGYNKSYLCKFFKGDTESTINEYLNRVRVDNAAKLLETTDMELSAISEAVGFHNIYHFIRTFKKFMGLPPGNYRRNELLGYNTDDTGERLFHSSVIVSATILKGGIYTLLTKTANNKTAD